MNYCVVKNTVIIINSNNPDEVMLEDAINSSFTSDEVEIISQEEYQNRVNNAPKGIQEPIIEDRLTCVEEILMSL
jgi:ABC-type branched-subunit amino acid transport system substrate-binding protein